MKWLMLALFICSLYLGVFAPKQWILSTALGGERLDKSASTSSHGESPAAMDPKAWCQQMLRDHAPHYRRLFQQLENREKVRRNSPVLDILRLNEDDCQTEKNRERVHRAFSMHSKRIGVILPFGNVAQQSISGHILSAIQQYFRSKSREPSQFFVLKNTTGQSQSFEQRLAELIFKEHVTILIGGATRHEARLLEEWSKNLDIASLILYPKLDPQPSSRQVFYVSPDVRQMASAITRHIQARNIRRLAILRPAQQLDPLSEELTARLDSSDFTSQTTLTYQQGDYHSMEAAVRQLFRINDPARQDELAELVRERKEAAEEQQVSFDPRTIMLPPKVEVDAIYIADNFRSVRHLVNIFKFFNAPKLPLIGNQQWRAPEIMVPPEPYLEGSVFFDFVGSYQNLPQGITVPRAHSEYFTTPEAAGSVDIKIMVTHALALAEQAIQNPQTRRYQVFRALEQSQNRSSRFFDLGPAFNSQKASLWPTFLFTLEKEAIVLSRRFDSSEHRLPNHRPKLQVGQNQSD